MSKCGVVILNYNSYHDTVALVNKIEQFPSIDLLCVVDNNSRDDFDGVFQSPKVHYIKNKVNGGYSAGNNIGFKWLIEEQACEYVYIANPDVDFEEETIAKLNNTLDSHQELAIVSSTRYGANGAKIHQYFDFPKFNVSYKHCFFIGRSKIEKEKRRTHYNKIKENNNFLYVDAVPGAFFGIRAKFLKENNYMYEGIFMYGEEIILGKQASLRGYKSAVIGGVYYYHNHKGGRFSSLNGVIMDHKSLKLYYKMFNKNEYLKRAILAVAVFLGNTEYTIAYYLYNAIVSREEKNAES